MFVLPAQAGIPFLTAWIPACAGTTDIFSYLVGFSTKDLTKRQLSKEGLAVVEHALKLAKTRDRQRLRRE